MVRVRRACRCGMKNGFALINFTFQKLENAGEMDEVTSEINSGDGSDVK